MKIADNLSNIPKIIKNAVYNRFYVLRDKKMHPETDLKLIYTIQPVNGIKFEDNYWMFGDGYMSCIHIHSLPVSIRRHWLSNLFVFDNTIVTIDMRPVKLSDTKESIERVMNDNLSTLETTKSVLEAKDAQATVDRLNELLDSISQIGRILLAVDLRIYVSGRSFYAMEQNVAKVVQRLSEMGYSRFGRNLSEQKEEYLSLFLSSAQIQETTSAREGFPLPTNVVAQGLPFCFNGHQDENGYYLGDTASTSVEPGTLLWNPFYKDKLRSSYDLFVCGVKGSGKSTVLKYLIEQLVSTGNKIRVIDVTGEFEDLVQNLGGAVIKFEPSGRNCILNMFEILRMDENEAQNYLMHITKLVNSYKILKPNFTDDEIKVFKTLIKKLYVKFGIVSSMNDTVYEGVTGRKSEAYPLFSDFIDVINDEIKILENNNTAEGKRLLEIIISVKITVSDIVDNYGAIFNAHTNIPDILSSDVISFDLSNLTGLEANIMDMQLNNVISMAYDSCMDVGMKMKKLYDKRLINEEDIVHHIIILDECHISINAKKPFAIDRIRAIIKQDRKYFIGLYLATQHIADMCRGGTSDANTDMKSLFEECQYKMIFRQDPGAIEYLEASFKNILTPPQIDHIPEMENQEAMLVLDSHQTVRFRTKNISPAQLAYYGGGA